MRAVFLAVALAVVTPILAKAQAPDIKITVAPVKLPDASVSAVEHPATPSQIREYLSLSGELDAYRVRWVSALDRSIGAPYWPESFWTTLKTSMQHADLLPMYTAWYQHTVTEVLMQQILDTYKANGKDHFLGSPACIALGETQLPYMSEMDKLTLANTLAVVQQVYALYKPQIKAAREAYLSAHPDYVDR